MNEDLVILLVARWNLESFLHPEPIMPQLTLTLPPHPLENRRFLRATTNKLVVNVAADTLHRPIYLTNRLQMYRHVFPIHFLQLVLID